MINIKILILNIYMFFKNVDVLKKVCGDTNYITDKFIGDFEDDKNKKCEIKHLYTLYHDCGYGYIDEKTMR